MPTFSPPEPREARSDARTLDCESWPDGPRSFRRDLARGVTQYEWSAACNWEIASRRYRTVESTLYEVNDARPGEARFRGEESYHIDLPGRSLELRSVLEVRSDSKTFYANFVRRILENDDLVREKSWSEAVPRQFQ